MICFFFYMYLFYFVCVRVYMCAGQRTICGDLLSPCGWLGLCQALAWQSAFSPWAVSVAQGDTILVLTSHPTFKLGGPWPPLIESKAESFPQRTHKHLGDILVLGSNEKIWWFLLAEGNLSVLHWQVSIKVKAYWTYCLITGNAIWFRGSNAVTWNGYNLWDTATLIIYWWAKCKSAKSLCEFNFNMAGLSNCHLNSKRDLFLKVSPFL